MSQENSTGWAISGALPGRADTGSGQLKRILLAVGVALLAETLTQGNEFVELPAGCHQLWPLEG